MGTQDDSADIKVGIYEIELASIIVRMDSAVTAYQEYLGDLNFPKDTEECLNFCASSMELLKGAVNELTKCLEFATQVYTDMYKEVISSSHNQLMANFMEMVKDRNFQSKRETLSGLIMAINSRISEIRAKRAIIRKDDFYTSDSSVRSLEFGGSPVQPEPISRAPKQAPADVRFASKSVDNLNQPQTQPTAPQYWQQGVPAITSQTVPNTPFRPGPIQGQRPFSAFYPISRMPVQNQPQYQFQPMATSSSMPNPLPPQPHHMLNSNLPPGLHQGRIPQQPLPSPVPPPVPSPAPINYFQPIPNPPQMYPLQPQAYNNPQIIIQRESVRKTKIPEFDGTGDFTEFWSMFEAIVHLDPNYNLVEKVTALKEAIVGDAAVAITGIQAIPRNYQWMIETLHERFANLPVNRSSIISELEQLPYAGESPLNWTKTLDQIKSAVNRMVSAGENILDRNEHMWEKKICEKFPNRIVVPILVKFNQNATHTLREFLRDLTGQVLAQASARQQLTRRENKEASEEKHLKQPQAETKPKFLYKEGFACFLCGKKGHYSRSCPNIKEPSEILKTLRAKNACEKCYSTFHTTGSCRKENCSCGGAHYIKLCSVLSQTRPQNRQFGNPTQRRNPDAFRVQGTSQSQNAQQHSGQHSIVDLTNVQESQTILMTVEGEIFNEKTRNFQKVLFFIDPGAQVSLIQETLAKECGLISGEPQKKTLYGIGGISENFETFKVHLKIRTSPNSTLYIKVLTKPIITTALSSVDLNVTDSKYLQQFGIQLSNAHNGQSQVPGILIGIDYFRHFVELKDVLQLPSGLQVTKTILGPTVFGAKLNEVPLNPQSSPNIETTTVNSFVGVTVFETSEKTTDEMVSEMFELEGLGIRQAGTADTKAVQYYQEYRKKLKFENGEITAPFPLKTTAEQIHDNFPIAFRRLQALCKQLQVAPKVKEWYVKIIKKYLDDGIIEEVDHNQINWGPKFYMPHHGVWKEEKNTPLRIVFDASSRAKNEQSLNDVIEKGECFITKIHDIIIRLRLSPIILMGDIEAAFTQVRISEEHRDLCRFLWVRNPNESCTRNNTVTYRFRRLPFGINASPSILNISLMEFLTQQNSQLSDEIMECLYVDNILLSASSPEEALEKYQKSKQLFQKVSMNLREYSSNNSEVNSMIPEIDRGKIGDIKILGVHYNTNSDNLNITIKFPDMPISTKRQALSQLHSVYDPIGLAAPALVRLKLIMREIFEAKLEWNSPLPPELKEKWTSEIQRVNNMKLDVPRIVSTSTKKSGTLWGFADASLEAMAVSSYFQSSETDPTSTLLSGKTKLAPKKRTMTIPQLELSAIEMLLLLFKSMQQSLSKITENINILSDSTIALTWIKTTRKVPRHVHHQVQRVRKLVCELQEDFAPLHFFHVPTNFNIADIGTRGEFGSSLADSEWLTGPSWASKPKTEWPIQSIEAVPETNEAFIEKEFKPIVNVLTTTILSDVSGWIDLTRFSKVQTAIRTIARIGKGLKNWTNRVNQNTGHNIYLNQIKNFEDSLEITATDFGLAENMLIQQEQSAVEINELRKRFPHFRFKSDENKIIRAVSRLDNAAIPRDSREPIVIPPNSFLVNLLIRQAHEQMGHGGNEMTKTALRQRFLIPKVGRKVQQFVSRCIICKRFQGLPMGAPDMPQLPRDRVTAGKPFEYTGIDYLGPLKGKNDKDYHVCLFTCLNTRAVHLETAENLTTGGFLRCLIKFVSRRGVPKVIRSDNGRQFELADRMIRTASGSTEEHEQHLMSYCAQKGIKWMFNVAKAPWMGGAWERLVGSVKKAFNKSFGRKKLTMEELSTSIVQIEAILNTRPLTHTDPSDLSKLPLRPIDFLQGSLKYSIPNFTDTNTEDPEFDMNLIQTVAQAREAIQYSETITEKFWKQWKTEYLTAIKNVHKFTRKQPRHQSYRIPQVGEIVIIQQDFIPRGAWKFGRIEKLLTSSDGLIRSVQIRLPNYNLIERSLNMVVPLEIRSKTLGEIVNHKPAPQPTDSPSTERRIQPARAAKTRARQTMQVTHSETNDGDLNEDNNPRTRINSIIEKTSEKLQRKNASAKINSSGIIALLLACSMAQGTTGFQFNCTEHEVLIGPMTTNWSICIAGKCAEHVPSNFSALFPLPVHPTRTEILVAVSDGNETTEISCFPAKFCDKAAPFLSKSLLGNPHCNPENALISTAIICVIVLGIVTVIPATIWSAIKLYRSRKEPAQTLNIEQTHTDEVQLSTFNEVADKVRNFRPVSPTHLITLVTFLSLVSITLTCQIGYTRTNVEMFCDQDNDCYLEFTKELLFNPLVKELCLELIVNNKTIGTLNVTHISDRLQCDKFSKFYIRETETEVFTAYRCPLFGSCVPQTCNDLPNQYTAPELAETKEYPGYSYCRIQNWFWCPTSESGCYFFKVAQVPQNNKTFEVFQCNGWFVTSTFEINFSTQYSTETSKVELRPYEPLLAHHLNMTVISSSHPYESYLDRTFASSESETLILPQNFVHGATCASLDDAERFFLYCNRGPECSCSLDSGEPKCNCPYHSLASLRTNSDNVLPLRTGHTTLSKKGPELVADGVTGETTLVVALNNITSTATAIILQHCDVNVGELNGCYSCSTGATVEIECKTNLKMFAVVSCQSQSFQVTCSSKQPKNNVTLHYENALINDQCTVNCGINNTEIQIKGTLSYHPHIDPNPVNPNGTHPHSPFDWFHDFTFPDLGPLFKLIFSHWKTSIALGLLILVLVGLTISMGPTLILSILELLFGILSTIIKFLVDMIVLAIEMGSRILRASRQTTPTGQ